MARWDDALDSLLDLYLKWNSEEGRRYADLWIRNWETTRSGIDPGTFKSLWGNFHGRILTQMRRADPIYIDPDMMTVIESAYPTFTPEPLSPTDLITNWGFIALPRPFYYKVSDDDEVREDGKIAFRYIMWGIENHKYAGGTEQSVLLVTIWRGPNDKDDYPEMSWGNWPYLITLVPWALDGKTTYPNELGQWHQVAQKLETIWRLMLQTITIKTQMRASRSTNKRLEKSDYTRRGVTVITLRRPKSESSGEHRDVEWTKRWLVSGHWRNQWFPSLGMHKQILINPYIKGPLDKPLEIRDRRVFQLVR